MALRFSGVGAAVVGVLIAAGPVPAGGAEVPRVPRGHPRVYVRPSDLPLIKEKIAISEFRTGWNEIRKAAAGGGGRRRGRGLSAVCGAFVYLLTEDRKAGRDAIDKMLPELKASKDARTFYVPFHFGACVYDWCYDLLTDEEKRTFVREFERIAGLHTPGFPARAGHNVVVGHSCEGWLLTGQLPAGAAIYDEAPKLYDAAARLFIEKFVPPRDFHYAGHWHHQGDSYFGRYAYDIAATWLFRRLGAGDVFTREQQFVPYQFIYCMRPDGQQMRRGDGYNYGGKGGRKLLMALLTGCYYDDPYLLGLVDSGTFGRLSPFERIFEVLFRTPGLKGRPVSELPLAKYFSKSCGEMVARTGWEMGAGSRDALVYMRIGEHFFGNHQRRDFGTFQVYYRGALAIATGLYEGVNAMYGSDHWRHYYHQTLAHNGLLIFDPNEKMTGRRVNDGGQKLPASDHPRDFDMLLTPEYLMGTVTAHEFGPNAMNPDYSYIAGDITKAYTGKVRLVTRSMAALSLRNPGCPAALVVFDRVVSSNLEYKKTWLLHSIQEPRVEASTITIVRDEGRYGGKLVAEVLLPRGASIRKVGGPGKDFWVESVGKNYPTRSDRDGAEPGAWRVEVSPAAPANADVFLHVMTVMDATTQTSPAVRMIEGPEVIGAQVLDRAVLFGKNPEPLSRAGFKLEGGGRVRVLVCDLIPGTWVAKKDGRTVARNLPATNEGRCVYFEAGPGRYTVQRTSGRIPPTPPDKFWDRLRGITPRGGRLPAAKETPRATKRPLPSADHPQPTGKSPGPAGQKDEDRLRKLAEEAVPVLKRWIIQSAGSGRQEKVFVPLMGRATRGKLLLADETGISVRVRGRTEAVAWNDLSAKDLYRIAKIYAGDPGKEPPPDRAEILAAFGTAHGIKE